MTLIRFRSGYRAPSVDLNLHLANSLQRAQLHRYGLDFVVRLVRPSFAFARRLRIAARRRHQRPGRHGPAREFLLKCLKCGKCMLKYDKQTYLDSGPRRALLQG